MTHTQEQRLIEIRFYLAMKRLVEYHSNIEDLLTLIDTLALFRTFNTLAVHDAMMKVLSDRGYKPIKQELAVLLWIKGEPIRNISKASNISNSRVYTLVEDFKRDPFPFKLAFTNERRAELEKFVNVLEQFCKVGGAV